MAAESVGAVPISVQIGGNDAYSSGAGISRHARLTADARIGVPGSRSARLCARSRAAHDSRSRMIVDVSSRTVRVAQRGGVGMLGQRVQPDAFLAQHR